MDQQKIAAATTLIVCVISFAIFILLSVFADEEEWEI